MRHRDLLWRLCSGYRLSNAWTAEDAMQEVCVDLWHAYPHYRGDSSERTWVYGVALKTLARLHRKRSNRHTSDGGKRDEPAAHGSAEWQLRMYIDTFGTPDNTIFNAYLDGFTNSEIAEMTHLTPAAVANRIARRKQQIRKEYGK